MIFFVTHCLRQYIPLTVVVTGILMSSLATRAMPAQKRSLTVEDCVRTRRIMDQELAVSPDGTRIAYVVKAPDVANNRNVFRLYLRVLQRFDFRDNGKVVLEADRISHIRWLSGGKLAARVDDLRQKRTTVVVIDSASESTEVQDLPEPVDDYAMNADGSVVVFSRRIRTDPTSASKENDLQRRHDLYGYAIPFGGGTGDVPEGSWPTYELFLARREAGGQMEVRQLTFVGPGDEGKRSVLRFARGLDLSPDGKFLLLTYSAEKLPAGWDKQPLIKQLRGLGSPSYSFVLGLYEVETGKLRLDFNYQAGAIYTKWADDSQAYSVVSASPFGSAEASRESAAAVKFGNEFFYLYRFNHLFTVDAHSGVVTLVLSRDTSEPGNPKFWQDLPLSWNQSLGKMLVRRDDQTFVWMEWTDGVWKETGRFDVSDQQKSHSSFSSDSKLVAAISQSPMIPPDIYVFNTRTKQGNVVTNLNPEYEEITLGAIERIAWTNRYGSKCLGHLIKPVGYEPGKRYPLLILSADDSERFVSDIQLGTMGYAPQSLANAGFAVVLTHYPRNNKIPLGMFPGKMREAYNWMAMADSIAELLVKRGLADKNKIGIAGFSRTSSLTDFTITHSSFPFIAASSADGGSYTFASYFNDNLQRTMDREETELGGPPYGTTFKNWMRFGVPFNAGRIRASVLLEYNDPIGGAYEFFVALTRMGKPVELYRYPKGSHPLDTPFERVASLQRNVDWFRFWMQGVISQPPEYDPQQYVRWEELRAQQKWNQQMWARGKDPTLEFLKQTLPGGVIDAADPAPAAKKFKH